ncbi:MAG: hypothetical protein IPF66_23195 [Holophagales bacterium]|nr:hypothetical protein [Holophagales bacterium]
MTSFSSDGRLVAGHGISRSETYHGLWLHDLEKRQYERLPVEGACPQLVNGGSRIYFLRQGHLFAPATVALLDRASGKTFDVLPQDSEPPSVAFAAAPDGSALYLVRERSHSDIWLMR